jgi:PAS domain S-box-containing protein
VHLANELFWRKDGTSLAVEYSSYPVRLNGVVQGAVVAFNDITDRKATEEALKESEERFRSLVTTTAQIVWLTRPDGKFSAEQAEWLRFTGQTSQQAMDWGWLNAVHPEDRERTRGSWQLAIQSRVLYQHEHRLRRFDSLYRHMLVRAVPVMNSDGSVREWIGIHTDITDRKKRRSRTRATSNERTKGQA